MRNRNGANPNGLGVAAGLRCFGFAVAVSFFQIGLLQADESAALVNVGKSGIRANSSSAASALETQAELDTADDDSKINSTSQSPSVLSRGMSPRIERSGSSATSASPSRSSRTFEMLWPLTVVLLFVGACAWAAKRWMPKTLRNSINAGGALHILARQSLSTKQSLCLVRVGRRLVLTGISPDRITALAEFTNAEEVASIMATVESKRAGSFTSVFAGAIEEDGRSATIEEQSHRSATLDSESDDPIPMGDLAQTRARVQKLLARVRDLTSDVSTSAEPAQQAAAAV